MKYNSGLVSVIIPTYNRALLCKHAVESVLSQTYDNVEVIVVDDGSQDNIRDAIANMDNRIKYIYQENAGVSAARNTGLRCAKGEYVAFLDSDDIWLPRKLEAQISVLQAFPDVGMVWTDMKAIDENGSVLYESFIDRMYASYKYFNREKNFSLICPLSKVWENCPAEYLKKRCYKDNIFPWMFMGNLVHTSTVVLSRQRQEKVGYFDVDLIKSGEDYDFHLRTCREGDVAYIDVPLIHYQVGAADQLTESKYMIWIARNNLKTVKKMYAVAKDEIDLPRFMILKRLAQSHAWVGYAEFSRDRIKARKEFIESLNIFPFQLRVIIYLCLSFFNYSTIDQLRHIKKVFKKDNE